MTRPGVVIGVLVAAIPAVCGAEGAPARVAARSPAQAAGDGEVGFYYTHCFGDILKWKDDRARMKRLPVTLPDGSPAAEAVIASERVWNRVPGDSFQFIDATDNDEVMVLGGDGNEMSLIYNDFLDGAPLARTFMRYDWCGPLDNLWPGHNMLMKESDILVNEHDYTFNSGIPDPRRLEPAADVHYLRPVVLHELGHAFGLSATKHEDRSIATMNSRYPGGWYPGFNTGLAASPPFETGFINRAIPHGDDRTGIRFIYPGSGAHETDIAVLNFAKMDTSSTQAILLDPPSPDVVCPGDAITIEYNFGNVGTETVTFNLGFYLSKDVDISTTDILVDSETWFAGAGLGSYGPGLLSRTLTIPSGDITGFSTTYFVGIYADFDRQLAEARETNNAVALPGTIRIRSKTACGP